MSRSDGDTGLVAATLDQLLAGAELAAFGRTDHGAAPVPTRYVTAMRNVVASKTLDS